VAARSSTAAPESCTPFVVFSFGVNDTTLEDGQRRVSEARSVENVHEIFRIAKQCYSVAIIGPPPGGDTAQNSRTRRLSQLFAAVAETEGTPFLSVFDQLAEDAIWMNEVQAGDGAHPGAAGYSRLDQTTEDWHPCLVTLSATKGLNPRFFAPLRMTMLVGHVVKYTNVMWSDLAALVEAWPDWWFR
jgi:hypothetical protein